jgi:pimeloyl-ACP methyl ester carboxylesterase
MKKSNRLSIEDFFIRAAGHNLRVRTLLHQDNKAANSRPRLVFLHEGLGCIEVWQDFPLLLSRATGCNTLIYDRWGHGKSDPLDINRTLRYLHDEALASLPKVLMHSQVDECILIGHSDGGSIALLFAAEHPQIARGVITEAAHVFVEDITLKGIQEAMEIWKNTDLKQKLARYHGDKTENIFNAWAKTWLSPEFKTWNIEDCLPKISCQVLVIQGEDDQYGSKAQVEAIAGKVNGPVKSLLIPKCAHIPHKEARDVVAGEMIRFIHSLL